MAERFRCGECGQKVLPWQDHTYKDCQRFKVRLTYSEIVAAGQRIRTIRRAMEGDR